MLIIMLLFIIFIVSCNVKNSDQNKNLLCHDEATGTFVECAKLVKTNKDLQQPEVVPSEKIGIRIGDSAPDFILYDTNGNQIRLSDYKGKQAVIVDFFATWCPYCNNEMPRLNKIVDSYGGKIQIIAIDDDKENVATIKSFGDKYNFLFPLLVDPDHKVTEMYQITGHPYTFYINKEGVIIDKKYGSSEDQELKSKVEKINF